MGIKWFTSFVKKNIQFQKVKLTDFGTVVIDGNNICHLLYHQNNCDWQLGGEYPEFYSKVKVFFEQICDVDVKPIVVFDGLRDINKMETVIQRKKQKYTEMLRIQEIRSADGKEKVAPVLMIQTFIDVLQDQKIQFHISAGDADVEVAAVANSLRCPVLASDSDYFLFELKCGFIPLDMFSVTKSCSLFRIDMFQRHFNLRDPTFRLLIPAIHGNDFLENATDQPEQDAYNFWHTLETAQAYDSCEEYFSRNGTKLARSNFQAAEKQYCNPKLPSDNAFKAFISCQNLPEWVFEAYKRGCFHPFLLNMKKHNVSIKANVVEDISRKSAWNCSGYIRRCLYGFMELSADITEIVRKDASPEVIQNPVTPTKINCSWNIKTISKMTEDERKNIVLHVLLNKCEYPAKFRDDFDKLEEKWKLPIAATIYWFHHSSVMNEHILISLLLCFLNCSTAKICPPFKRLDLSCLHAYAQWQCVYRDAMALNCLVKEAFVTTSPSLLFSGKVAMAYVSCPSAFLLSEAGGPFLGKLLELVMCCKKKPLEASQDKPQSAHFCCKPSPAACSP